MANFDVVLLVDDVDRVDGQSELDVLCSLTQCKVMSKSRCGIFSRMFFSKMLSSLVKLSCKLSIMMSILMMSSPAMMMLTLMRMLLSLIVRHELPGLSCIMISMILMISLRSLKVKLLTLLSLMTILMMVSPLSCCLLVLFSFADDDCCF